MGEASRINLHCTGTYFIYKIIGLTIYTTILSQLMDGYTYHTYKLWTCILITPIIKYIAWKPNTTRDYQVLCYSIFADTFGAWLGLYLIPHYFMGFNFGWAAAVGLLWNVPVEYIHYLLFDKGTGTLDDRYVVKLSKNPMDALLAVAIGLSYSALGWYMDYTDTRWSMVTWYSVFLWILIATAQDVVFGAAHWCMHSSPELWIKHKLHHEYKREDLNMFATFYADFLDSVFMASGYYVSLFLCIMFGGSTHQVMTDTGAASLMSHNKYVHTRGACLYFWEYDALDVLFGRIRMSEYHHSHHLNLTQRYGLFGFIPDSWYPLYVPPVLKMMQQYGLLMKTTITTSGQEKVAG